MTAVLDLAAMIVALLAPILLMFVSFSDMPTPILIGILLFFLLLVLNRVGLALATLVIFAGRVVSNRDGQLAEMYGWLSRAVRSGAPLADTCSAMAGDAERSSVRHQLLRVSEALRRGGRLSEALGVAPRLFPATDRAMLAAGEQAGMPARTLEQLAIVRGGQTQYGVAPLLAGLELIVGVLAVVFTLLFVLPKFKSIYDMLGSELPPITQLIFDIYGFFNHYGPAIVFVFILFVLFLFLARGEALALTMRMYPRLSVPYWSRTLSRFTFTLGALVRSGTPLADAFSQAVRAGGSRLLLANRGRAQAKIAEGATLSQVISDVPSIPRGYVVQLQRAQRDSFADELLEISRLLQSDIDATRTSRWSLMLPAVLIAVGAFYFVFVLSLYLPLFYIPKLVGR